MKYRFSMRKQIVFFSLMALLSLVCHAALKSNAIDASTRKALSLRDAIFLGLRFSPDIQNAEIDRLIQRYNLRLADWQYEWQYHLEGTGAWEHQRFEGNDTSSRHYTMRTGASRQTALGTQFNVDLDHYSDGQTVNPNVVLTLTQPLLKGASSDIVLYDWMNAQDSEKINRLLYRQSVMARVNEIIKNYRQCIVMHNHLLTAEHALEESKRTYQNNALQIRLGRMPSTINIPQASQVESNRFVLEQTRNQFLRAKQTLLQSIGLDPDTVIAIPNDLKVANKFQFDSQKIVEQALRKNIDYRVKQINFKQTQRALVKAEDDLRWQLDLNASATLGNSQGSGNDARLASLTNGDNHSESLAVTLKIPLANKNLNYALEKQKLAVQKEKNLLVRAKFDLIMTIKNSLADIDSHKKQVDIAAAAIKFSKQTYAITLKKQQLGRASSLEVTQSQNDLIQKKMNFIQTKVNYLNALTDLDLILDQTLNHWHIQLRQLS